MDGWDEEKLRKVVSSKGNPRTTTDVSLPNHATLSVPTVLFQIVCKYFIEAIETEKQVDSNYHQSVQFILRIKVRLVLDMVGKPVAPRSWLNPPLES